MLAYDKIIFRQKVRMPLQIIGMIVILQCREVSHNERTVLKP